MNRIANNIYQKYLQSPWSNTYRCAGIYGITVNRILVYIGKSGNILSRMAEHFAAILQAEKEKNDKYAVLAEAKQRGMNIRFVILYRAQASSQKEIQEEIGEQEGVFIRKYMPPLNTEIPHEDDWHRFDKRACDFSLGSVLKGGVVFNA